MSDLVVMRHPTLPGQPITVGAQSVPHHEAAGWQRVEDVVETVVDLVRHEDSRRRGRRNDAGTPASVDDTEAGTEPAANATEGDVTP